MTGGVPAGTSLSGLGLLTLSANSTLDFDSLGNGTLLAFAGFNPGAFTLNITNWTNTTFDATLNSGVAADDRLVFNSDQSGNLSKFDFGFGPGVGVSQIALDAGFYEVGIAPVPEPSSIATVMGLLGLVGWRERRKARQARAAERRAV